MKITTRPLLRIQDKLYPVDVKKIPLVELRPLQHKAFENKSFRINKEILVLLTSPGTIDFIETWLKDLIQSNQVKVLSLSEGVSKSLNNVGLEPYWTSGVPNVAAMMTEISKARPRLFDKKPEEYLVIHPCSLETNLKQSVFTKVTGIEIRNILVYQPVLPNSSLDDLLSIINEIDLKWFFYSGSAVRSFQKWISKAAIDQKVFYTWSFQSIGESSAKELNKMNLKYESLNINEAEQVLYGV